MLHNEFAMFTVGNHSFRKLSCNPI